MEEPSTWTRLGASHCLCGLDPRNAAHAGNWLKLWLRIGDAERIGDGGHIKGDAAPATSHRGLTPVQGKTDGCATTAEGIANPCQLFAIAIVGEWVVAAALDHAVSAGHCDHEAVQVTADRLEEQECCQPNMPVELAESKVVWAPATCWAQGQTQGMALQEEFGTKLVEDLLGRCSRPMT